MKRAIAIGLVLAGAAATGLAQETVTLFDQVYRVQRFDVAADVFWTYTYVDPNDPNNPIDVEVSLIEVEAAHWVGDGRLLLGTNTMAYFSTPPDITVPDNFVVEVEVATDEEGFATGISYVQTLIIQDETPAFLGGWGLKPRGVTINTGMTGLAAGGNILIGDSEAEDGTDEGLRGYDWDGHQLEWPVGSGCLSVSSGKFCGISTQAYNADVEDLVYVPVRDRVFTLEDDLYDCEVLSPDGTHFPDESFDVPYAGTSWGENKGVTFIPNNGMYPPALQVSDGVLLITLDDQGPALLALDLDGNEVALEPLTDDQTPTGEGILERDCVAPLQLESIATDPATGRLFLVNQGDFDTCNNYVWVLTPLACPGDCNCDGAVDLQDINPFAAGLASPATRCSPYNFDVNGDGVSDLRDINPFVGLLSSGSLPIPCEY